MLKDRVYGGLLIGLFVTLISVGVWRKVWFSRESGVVSDLGNRRLLGLTFVSLSLGL